MIGWPAFQYTLDFLSQFQAAFWASSIFNWVKHNISIPANRTDKDSRGWKSYSNFDCKKIPLTLIYRSETWLKLIILELTQFMSLLFVITVWIGEGTCY